MADERPRQATQFTFFRSYYEATDGLDDAERLLFYDSLFSYAFNGEVPEFENRYLKMMWTLTEPSVQKSIKQSITNANNRRKNENADPENDRNNDGSNGGNDRNNDRKNENENGQKGRRPRNRIRKGLGVGEEEDGSSPLEGNSQSSPPEYGPPRCRMDGCDGVLLFDDNVKKLRCNKCRSTFGLGDL